MAEAAGKRAMTQAPRDAGAQAVPDVHALELTLWDVPSAIGAGERFTVYVGARCSAGCDLGGKALSLFDRHGASVCTVKLGCEVYPGTEALYFAHAEARAPLEAGSHPWEARMESWAAASLHAACTFPLALNVVAAPDCEITVSVIDRESQTPISGARVVMHPYRAVTDGNGMAKLKVCRGPYDLLVSGRRYLPSCSRFEVSTDITTSVELDADVPDEEAYE